MGWPQLRCCQGQCFALPLRLPLRQGRGVGGFLKMSLIFWDCEAIKLEQLTIPASKIYSQPRCYTFCVAKPKSYISWCFLALPEKAKMGSSQSHLSQQQPMTWGGENRCRCRTFPANSDDPQQAGDYEGCYDSWDVLPYKEWMSCNGLVQIGSFQLEAVLMKDAAPQTLTMEVATRVAVPSCSLKPRVNTTQCSCCCCWGCARNEHRAGYRVKLHLIQPQKLLPCSCCLWE